MPDHFVNYTVGHPVSPASPRSTNHYAGPYADPGTAEDHRRDIAGYEGVSSVFVTTNLPAKDYAKVGQ